MAEYLDQLRAQLHDWKQAAGVEASLRREFLARAEKAEAEVERLRAALRAELDRALDDNARLRIDTDRLIHEVERLRSIIRGYAGHFVTRQDVRAALEQKAREEQDK